jgi:hypothetical protein
MEKHIIENKIDEAYLSLDALKHIKEVYCINVVVHETFAKQFYDCIESQIEIINTTITELDRLKLSFNKVTNEQVVCG